MKNIAIQNNPLLTESLSNKGRGIVLKKSNQQWKRILVINSIIKTQCLGCGETF
jgi:hypothetical protein